MVGLRSSDEKHFCHITWPACVMLRRGSRDGHVTVTLHGIMNEPPIHYIKAEFIETVSVVSLHLIVLIHRLGYWQ